MTLLLKEVKVKVRVVLRDFNTKGHSELTPPLQTVVSTQEKELCP